MQTGTSTAAELETKLGTKVEIVRELPYRLYTLSEHKKRATEVLAHNGLAQSFPQIVRLAQEGARTCTEQVALFEGGDA